MYDSLLSPVMMSLHQTYLIVCNQANAEDRCVRKGDWRRKSCRNLKNYWSFLNCVYKCKTENGLNYRAKMIQPKLYHPKDWKIVFKYCILMVQIQ